MLAAAVLAAAAAFALAAPAGPDAGGGGGRTADRGDVVLWRGDYEASGQFQTTPWNARPDAPVRVVDPAAREGAYVGRYAVPAGGERSEDVPQLPPLAPGDDLWFGFSTRLADGFPVGSSDWQVITQWKNDGPGSPPLELAIRDRRFRLDGGANLPGRYAGLDLGPARTGVWDDWVVHVLFSQDPRHGVVDVWRGGERLVSGWHPPGGTLYPGLSSYLKIGYYRSRSISTAGVVLHDDWRVGTSLAAIA